AGVFAYLVGHHALAAAFVDVIRFTATRYGSIQGVPFGFGGQNPPLKYLFPLATLLTLFVCAHDWRTCLRDRLLWTCAAFALAVFLGFFPRPNIAHIAFAAPLACPLLAYCTIQIARRWGAAWWRYRYLVAPVAGVVIGLCVLSVLFFLRVTQEAL